MVFDGVIFDLDGVIVDSEPLHLESFNLQLERRYGFRITMQDWKERYLGKGSEEIWRAICAERGVDPGDIDQFSKERHEDYRRLARKQLRTVPGFHTFLNYLEGQSKWAIIASNGAIENVLLEVHSAHVEHLPRVTRDKVEHPKPAPDLYELAVERLGLPKTRLVVIEDSPAGIKAARKAGIAAIGLLTIESPEALKAAGATYIVKDFTELLAKHKKLFAKR